MLISVNQDSLYFPCRDHSFSTFAKFSKKLTFLNPWYARNVSFSGNFANVLNKWYHMKEIKETYIQNHEYRFDYTFEI